MHSGQAQRLESEAWGLNLSRVQGRAQAQNDFGVFCTQKTPLVNRIYEILLTEHTFTIAEFKEKMNT